LHDAWVRQFAAASLRVGRDRGGVALDASFTASRGFAKMPLGCCSSAACYGNANRDVSTTQNLVRCVR
jgi:hypothetical protein